MRKMNFVGTKTYARLQKLLAFTLVLVMLMTAVPSLGSTAYAAGIGIYKTTASVNLRSGPGTSYAVVQLVYENSEVTVTDTSDPEWYKIKLSDGTTGYISSEYLSEISTESGGTYTVTADGGVNMRSGPSTSSSVIVTLANGSTVTLIEKTNSEWFKVKTSGGQTGYVNSQYLTKGSSPAPTPPPEEPEEDPAPVATKGTYKTTAGVNMRSGAGTKYDVVKLLAKNTQLIVTSVSNANWYKVKLYNGSTGYVKSSYLSYVSSSTSVPKGTYRTTGKVNMRSGAGASYSVVSNLSKGTQLIVTGNTASKWYKVKLYNGKTGYVRNSYLEYISSSTSVPKGTYVTTSGVNMRSGAGTSYSVVKNLSKDTQLIVTGNTSSTWYKVKLYDGRTGYVKNSYLSYLSSSTTVPTGCYVTTGGVNMRSGAGTSYSVVKNLPKDTVLTVTDTSDSKWYKVKLDDGTAGFVRCTYLGFIEAFEVDPEEPDEEEPTVPDGTWPDTSKAGQFLRITAKSGLNVRKTASSSGTVIAVLEYHDIVTIIEQTNEKWYKIETEGGKVGYVSADYVESYSPPTGGSISISASAVDLPQYKTVYLKASSSKISSFKWSSSDTSVATVRKGYVYGVAPGTAYITCSDSTGEITSECKITVTKAEAVRFAYSGPNDPVTGESVKLVAVTGPEKTKVKFVVDGRNFVDSTHTTETATDDDYADNVTRVFSKSVTLDAGKHTVKVYSYENGSYSSDYYQFTVLVSSQSNKTATSSGERRVSDEMLELIADFEGYASTVYADTLAGGIATVGYGFVVYKNDQFYNNLTKTEAWGLLVEAINDGSYTKAVNNLVANNDLLISQNQFDALVSFTYNVGSGWTSKSDLRTTLLNTVDHRDLDPSSDSPISATVALDCNIYTGYGGKTVSGEYEKGTEIKIINKKYKEATKEIWYKTNKGWIRGGNVKFSSSGLTHDLNYVDSITFAENILAWHHASSKCVAGLLYRRLSEAKIFLYSDYAQADKSSTNYKKNTYGFIYPDCVKKYE